MALGKKKLKENSIKQKVMVIKQKESEEKSQRKLAKILPKQNSNTKYTFYWKEM